jgi:hypothetical protein
MVFLPYLQKRFPKELSLYLEAVVAPKTYFQLLAPSYERVAGISS